MKQMLAIVVAIAFCSGLEAANLTIAKNIRIDIGDQSYPLGGPSNLVNGAYPLSDGGYLVVGIAPTNIPWLRFAPNGVLVWSNSFQIKPPTAVAELQDGRLACLTYAVGDQIPHNSLFIIGPDGSGASKNTLPSPGDWSPPWEYTSLLADTNGFLVAGYGSSSFVMGLSTNLAKIWQTDYSSGGSSSMEQLAIRRDGGYFFAYDGPFTSGEYHTFAAVSTNGTVVGQIPLYGGVTNIGMYDQLVTMLPCGDGGLLAGFTSSTTTDGTKAAPFYGVSDIWLVRLDSSAHKLWDRSFGGVGAEALGSVQQTEDGGFLVAGWTAGSQVSGNKAVDGNGIWLLKLDANGFKEGESVIQSDTLEEPNQLLPAPTGYLLAATSTSWIADLNIRHVIDLMVTPTGSAFKVDYSFDLLNWTNLVSRYNGTINLEEDIAPGPKYFRCAEVR